MANITSRPRRIAWGMARSRNAWSTIVVGLAGSQKTAIRFSVIPRSVSVLKKLAPPSSAYLPASSATPNVVLDAEPASASAAQAHARTAVIRNMPHLSADQRLALSTASRSFPAPKRTSTPRVEHCIEEFSGAEADGVVRRQAGLLFRCRD